MQSTSEQPTETVFHFGAPVIRFGVGDSDNEQDVTGALPCTSAQQIRVTPGGLSDAEGHALDPFVARNFGWSVSVIFCSPFPSVDSYRLFFFFFFFFASSGAGRLLIGFVTPVLVYCRVWGANQPYGDDLGQCGSKS